MNLGHDGKWTRNCPKCYKLCYHNTKRKCREAQNKVQVCRSCAQKKDRIEVYVRICPRCSNEINYSGRKQWIRCSASNSLCSSCAAKIRKIDELAKRGTIVVPNYNIRACGIFDQLNHLLKWNGVHAQNGGEYQVGGYFVDYYEPNVNLVIEFDEPAHKYKIKKDMIRQTFIINQLNCRFFRIDNSTDIHSLVNTLKEVII